MGLSELSLLGTTFGVALLGGGHCFGMCGGIAALAGISRAPAYHGGRLIGYVSIGAIAGAFGKAAFAAVAERPAWQVGAVLLTAAVLGVQFWRVWQGKSGIGAIGAPILKARSSVSRFGGAFGYGLATALVPCGWFAYFGWIAAATGSPATGAAVFVSLWAGSLPALIAAAAAFRSVRERFPGAVFRKGAAVALLVVSLYSLESRLHGFADAAAVPGAPPVCGPRK